jgi:hypothetical protein
MTAASMAFNLDDGSYIKKLSGGIFNFFDPNGRGEIDFKVFLRRLEPKLQE